MLIYSFRPDRVYSGTVEVPDGTVAIPPFHSFEPPPTIPDGCYAIMLNGWQIVEGIIPVYPPPPTPEQIFTEIVTSTQARLDTFAQTKSYDGILSACTYASSAIPKFKLEGQYCVDQRDSTWNTLYSILAQVKAGTMPMPKGYSDVESLLPILTWPNEL